MAGIATEAPNNGPAGLQRRYMTILFCDLVDSTGLSEQLDPEELRELQLRYQRLGMTVMEHYGGFLASSRGDGLLIYFGYPTAHENDGERAVRAALKFMEMIPGLETALPGRPPLAIAIRIGIHTGLVVVGPELTSPGHQEHSVVGETANLAARLQSIAEPGTILISGETLSTIEELFETEPLGPTPIRGLSRLLSVHRVLARRPLASRTQSRWRRSATRMVGRRPALQSILAQARAAQRDGSCRIVLVSGDAGIGKTRLVAEATEQAELAGFSLTQLHCLEMFASTPLYLTVDFLWTHSGILVDDDEATRARKLAAMLAPRALDNPENVRTLAAMMGVDVPRDDVSRAAEPPENLRQSQFAVIRAWLARAASQTPLLLWIEDAHWLDPSSAELLKTIKETLDGTGSLVLITARTFPRGPDLPEADAVIELEQLPFAEALELAQAVPGAGALPDPLLARAVRTAEGVPLFLEQLIVSLIGKERHGATEDELPLPLTLAETMSERLDRVEGGRRIVQVAACIGRSFSVGFLANLLAIHETDLLERLEALVAAEILLPFEDGDGMSYEFRHSLLQRIAHESISQAERRIIHARIAGSLEAGTSGAPPVPELLAHHLTLAGASVEAIEAWLAAGQSAARGSAHLEAIAHLRRGLGLLVRVADPKRCRQLELVLQSALIGPLTATQGSTSSGVAECCRRGLDLCTDGDPPTLVFGFLFGLFTVAMHGGRVDEAAPIAELFVRTAERLHYDSGRVLGYRLSGMAALGQGKLATARANLLRSLELYDSSRDETATHLFGQNTRIHSSALLALTLICAGEAADSFRILAETIEEAQALGHAHSNALALAYAGTTFGVAGAPETLMLTARRLVTTADRHRLGIYRTLGNAMIGWALCLSNDFDQGLATMERGIGELDAAGYHMTVPLLLAVLADGKRRVGLLDEAAALVARALRVTEKSADRWILPEIVRVDAMIAYERNQLRLSREIEARFRESAAMARDGGLPIQELRCLRTIAAVSAEARDDPVLHERVRALAHLEDLQPLARRAIAAAQRAGFL